jgi:hypothetical protein
MSSLFSKSGLRALTRTQQSSILSPRQLLKQILVMQSIYYFIGFVLILFMSLVSEQAFSLRLIFSWEPVRNDTTVGWTLVLLWLLDTFFSVLALTIVVGRSKLALDFTLTLHGIHFVICWVVSGQFPRSGLWWGLQAVSILLMLGLGTWSTQWRELRATFFEPIQMAPTAGVTTNGGSGFGNGLGVGDVEGGDLGSGLFTAPGHYSEEFELQPAAEASKKPILSNINNKQRSTDLGVKKSIDSSHGDDTTAANRPADLGFGADEESDDEGDITAGSKLLRSDRRSSGY